MRVLVTGARGMLGFALADACPPGVELLPTDVAELDITDAAAMATWLDAERPDAVLNAAAYTAVDDCESHEPLALAVNGSAPGLLARACAERGLALLHVSTDYVFDGRPPGGRPWREDDPTGPLSAYGRTKLAGELAVRESLPAHWIVRTQWLYGLGGRNFVETMLRLAGERDALTVVDDQTGSPTSTHTLAPLLWEILARRPAFGTYHAANAGSCSWFDFAREIFDRTGASVALAPMDSSQLDRPAPRPACSVLDTAKLRAALGHDIPTWQAALADYLARRPAPDATPS